LSSLPLSAFSLELDELIAEPAFNTIPSLSSNNVALHSVMFHVWAFHCSCVEIVSLIKDTYVYFAQLLEHAWWLALSVTLISCLSRFYALTERLKVWFEDVYVLLAYGNHWTGLIPLFEDLLGSLPKNLSTRHDLAQEEHSHSPGTSGNDLPQIVDLKPLTEDMGEIIELSHTLNYKNPSYQSKQIGAKAAVSKAPQINHQISPIDKEFKKQINPFPAQEGIHKRKIEEVMSTLLPPKSKRRRLKTG